MDFDDDEINAAAEGGYNINTELSLFNELPDEIIIKILSYLSPYGDTKNASLVNKKWNALLKSNEVRHRKNFIDAMKDHRIMWKMRKQRSYEITEVLIPSVNPLRATSRFKSKIQRSNRNIPSPRFSHGAVVLGEYMYVFAGSSSEARTRSTFNDTFRLDLSTYIWEKVKTNGLLPAPRECCVFAGYKDKPTPHLYKTIPYKGKIILFGGWCQPPADRLSIGARFFDDTQIFHVHNSKWERLELQEYPTARAGHSGSIVGNKLIIFGGSQRSNRLNDVWMFDIEESCWSRPYVQGVRPSERFGHAQFTLNEDTIMILGGCGGQDELFSDAWLLQIKTWRWSRISIGNDLHEPPDLWSHASTMVNNHVIVFSEEKKCPYCRCSIQNYHISKVRPAVDSKSCSCGRRNPEDLIQLSSPKLQMYSLDCTNILFSSMSVMWDDYKYLTPSPPSRRLFTAVNGVNEIIIFGGLQSTYSNHERSFDDSIISVCAKPP